MAALTASSSSWIPEDDLLLRSAVEAGASLEALAKGAVRFSRKFTVSELQDRWRSLLYDPDACADASARMVHLQLSDYSFPSWRFPSRFLNNNGNYNWNGYGRIDSFPNSSIKRKVESIRRIFYAKKKKSRQRSDRCHNLYDSGYGISVSDFGLDMKKYSNDAVTDTHNFSFSNKKMVNDCREDAGASSSGLFFSEFVADALMNFDSGDDVLEFIDVGTNSIINSCDANDINSLLISAPSELHDTVQDVAENTPKAELGSNSADFSGVEADHKDRASISDQIVSATCISSEAKTEEMICVLNTEDPEIPSNDDFIPPKRRPSVRKHAPGKNEECSTLNYANNFEIAESGASPNRVSLDKLVTYTKDTCLSEDEDRFEDEIGLPSFSDVEGMILEMDLCPDDPDSVELEALKYNSEESKKRVIRLEQSAGSFMHRRILCKGAFAVLYGRYSKHYIKEPEVILGRATEDMDVDIDLSKEGPANKISRRQAIIKLEIDGSFLLKNLGKSLMYVNGVEVVTGQNLKLMPSSLVEVKDLAFVFEVDHKSLMLYIEKNIREKTIKFEFSDEAFS